MKQTTDNNQLLRETWKSSKLSLEQALALINLNQLRPLAMSTFQAYMAPQGINRRRACPYEILEHAKKVLLIKK